MLPLFKLQFNISLLDSRQQASFHCQSTARSNSSVSSNAIALILTSLLLIIASLVVLLVREKQRGWFLERLLANRGTECQTITHTVVIEEPGTSKAGVGYVHEIEVTGLQNARQNEVQRLGISHAPQLAPTSEHVQSAAISRAETVIGEEVPSLVPDLRKYIGAQFNPSSQQATVSQLSSSRHTPSEVTTPESDMPAEQLEISRAEIEPPGRSKSGVIGFSGVSISVDFAASSTPPSPARDNLKDRPLCRSWLSPQSSDISRPSTGTYNSKWHMKHGLFINRKRGERQAEKKRKKEVRERAEEEAKVAANTEDDICLWDEPVFRTPRMEDGWTLHSDNSKSTSDLSMNFEETQPKEMYRPPIRATTLPSEPKVADAIKRHPAKNKLLSLLRGRSLFRNPDLLSQQEV